MTGKEWEVAYELHHVIPIELNGSNDPFNFIQLSQEEHILFTNFIRFVIPWSQGKTLTQNGPEIQAYLAKYATKTYKQHRISDLYWDWLNLRH